MYWMMIWIESNLGDPSPLYRCDDELCLHSCIQCSNELIWLHRRTSQFLATLYDELSKVQCSRTKLIRVFIWLLTIHSLMVFLKEALLIKLWWPLTDWWRWHDKNLCPLTLYSRGHRSLSLIPCHDCEIQC